MEDRSLSPESPRMTPPIFRGQQAVYKYTVVPAESVLHSWNLEKRY